MTYTENCASARLPAVSVAMQVTWVAPIGNSEPDDGAQVTGSDPSTASVAVGDA